MTEWGHYVAIDVDTGRAIRLNDDTRFFLDDQHAPTPTPSTKPKPAKKEDRTALVADVRSAWAMMLGGALSVQWYYEALVGSLDSHGDEDDDDDDAWVWVGAKGNWCW